METVVQQTHEESVRSAISNNVLISIIARVGYLVTRFFVPPFVLGHVTLEAYGLWATAFILVSYVGVSAIGISNVYIKYVAEYSAKKEFDRANSLLSTGMLITVPASVAVFAGIWSAWPSLSVWLKVPPALYGDAREVILMVVGIFLASLALTAFTDALSGVQRIMAAQGIWVVAYLIETALIFILVGTGRGIRGLAEAYLIRTILEISLSAVLAYRTIPWLRISPVLFSRDALRTLYTFGGVVQLTSLMAIALNSVERALAVPLVGLQAAGLLDIGKKLPSMAASIPSAFANSLTPAASYLQGGLEGTEQGREALNKLFLKGARYMNLAAAYFYGLLGVAPVALLGVWLGKHYEGAALLATVFAISTQIHLMTGPGTSILKGLGRPNAEFHYCLPNLLALVAFIPLSKILAGSWTATGIGIAVAASTIVSAAYFIWRSNRILGILPSDYLRRVAAPGVVPYLVCMPLALPATYAVAHVDRWTGAGIVVMLGAAYTLVLAAVVDRWIFDPGERLWFRAVLQQRLAQVRGLLHF